MFSKDITTSMLLSPVLAVKYELFIEGNRTSRELEKLNTYNNITE